MMDDAELLRRYSAERSETAFAELVRRHVDLVYSAALRRTAGDHHRAQEVTQMVFINLARKAASLVRHPVLPAWLHRTTAFAAADARRREARRTTYERAAAAEALATGPAEATFDWQGIRPILDETIDQLAERDREAIVLRFFGNRPFAEVGQRLGLSENAARMRVDRALEKLKERLARRGVSSSASALALGLSAQAVSAAPVGVAATATAAALAAGPSALAVLSFMNASKLTLGLLGGALALGTGGLIVQQKAIARLQREVDQLRSAAADLSALKTENRKLTVSLQQARLMQDGAADLPALLKDREELAAKVAAQAAVLAHDRTVAKPKVPIGQVFDPSQLDTPPKPTAQGRPTFPFEMRRAGKSGQVDVDFIVDSTGAVQNAAVTHSTQPEFETAALAAVSQWAYTAGQKGGAAVATHLQVPIVFTFNSSPGMPPPSAGPTDWFPTNGK